MFFFTLRDVGDVQPWGEPSKPTLGWFGLSDGVYHIEVGNHRLLEYAVSTPQTQFVDYQVARLHSDLLEILPDILDPVPETIASRLVDESMLATHKALAARAGDLDDPIWEALEAFSLRHLDTGYLSPPARISFWTDRHNTHVEWDNRECLIDGAPAWTAMQGKLTLPTLKFVSEVRRFHCSLMSAMRERIDQVRRGWLRAGVAIDLDELLQEQARRESMLDLSVATAPTAVPWHSAIVALR